MANAIEGINDETRKPNGSALTVHDHRGDVLEVHIESTTGLRRSATIYVWRQDFERLAVVAAAVAAEREACAKALDALAETEDKSEAAATHTDWRTIARSMGKAFRSGAAAIRSRK